MAGPTTAAHHFCLHLSCRVVKDTSSWSNKKELLEAEQASCTQLAAALAEVDEEGMRAKMQQASQERDEAQAACTRWVGAGGVAVRLCGCRAGRRAAARARAACNLCKRIWPASSPSPSSASCSAELAVQAAQNELAGAEAGDGRDASNRSLQERLADAQNAQVGPHL